MAVRNFTIRGENRRSNGQTAFLLSVEQYVDKAYIFMANNLAKLNPSNENLESLDALKFINKSKIYRTIWS